MFDPSHGPYYYNETEYRTMLATYEVGIYRGPIAAYHTLTEAAILACRKALGENNGSPVQHLLPVYEHYIPFYPYDDLTPFINHYGTEDLHKVFLFMIHESKDPNVDLLLREIEYTLPPGVKERLQTLGTISQAPRCSNAEILTEKFVPEVLSKRDAAAFLEKYGVDSKEYTSHSQMLNDVNLLIYGYEPSTIVVDELGNTTTYANLRSQGWTTPLLSRLD